MTKWTVKPSSQGQEKAQKSKKQHMGWKKGIFRWVLPVILTVATATGALLWVLPKLPVRPPTQNGVHYQGIVELWNVESFEGGVGSREGWLTARAAKFEKVHTGLYVHVTTLTTQQLGDKLARGDDFDLICFSRGAGEKVQDKLTSADIDVGTVKDNFLPSGQVNGVQYAIPLYTGVYCLFAREQMLPSERLVSDALTRTFERKVGKNTVTLAPLICGFTPYNSPLSALALSGGRGEVQVNEVVTQYEAYEKFLANNTAVTLLGTQRDMYRLAQRETNGKIEPLAFAPLGGYTDLVQYVGIGSGAGDMSEACRAFVQYLLEAESQSSLTDIRMFSVSKQTFYTTDRYREAEASLVSAYVPNVFGDSDAVTRQRRSACQTLAA